MRIGLFGFTVTHENMGCQALTCAFLEMIKKVKLQEPVEIVVFRSDKTLGVIPGLFPEMTFKLVNTTFHDWHFKMLREIKKCDVIFDESYGDGFSDIYFKKIVYRDTLIKCFAAFLCPKFIMTPQTYGPFKDRILEKFAGFSIRHADEVYARDAISADYAAKISKRNVKTVTDLAFSLPFRKILSHSEMKRVGVNISGLLWKGGFSNSNQFGLKTDYRDYCESLIKLLLKEGYEVHLIPHVTAKGEEGRTDIPDGDYPFCELLKQKYPETVLAPNFTTPFEAKNYIASMDYFIGARMHSTIGAFSSGVITIPFAYSRKFQGLFETIGYPYYVDGTKLSTVESLEMTMDYISNNEKLKNAASIAMNEISDKTQYFFEELKEILK